MENYLIWGTGQLAEINYSTLLLTGLRKRLNIVGFVDNNKEKWGSRFKDKPIFSPYDIIKLKYDYIINYNPKFRI